MKKRILSLFLTVLTLFVLCVPALAADPADVPAPIARTVSPSNPSAAVRKAAQAVFDEYYDAYYNGKVVDRLEDVMFMHKNYNYASGCQDFWYTFYDLDKNGSAELFIGSFPSGGQYTIMDMYEFVGGKAVRTFEGGPLGYRTTMTLLSNGQFKLDYVMMTYGSVGYYKLAKNGRPAKLTAGYEIDFAHNTYSDLSTGKTITKVQADKIGSGTQEIKLTGWTKFLGSDTKKAGLVTEGGKTYYYKNNIRQTGLLTIGGYTYYFSANDGHMFKSSAVNTGSGKLRYFDRQGHMLQNCWVNGGASKRYYAGSDGVLYSGLKEIGGKTYYFSAKNAVMLKGLVTTDNKGTQRYFSAQDGHMMRGGWITVGGVQKYYADANGVITKKR